MGYTTVIFDMDGTILNTLEDITGAVNAMRRREGLDPFTTGQVRRRVGNGVQVLMERSLPGGRDHPHFEAASAYYRAYYESHSLDKTQPYPGILALMAQLKARGIAMAVVSNKQREAVIPLSDLFFGDFMSLAMGDGPNLRRKPAPDMVWAALDQLGRPREEALYVGDSEVDIATARNAGLACCAVTWGYRDEALLASLHPDYLIHQPEELLSLFPALPSGR